MHAELTLPEDEEDQVVELTWDLPEEQPTPEDVETEFVIEIKQVDRKSWKVLDLGRITEKRCIIPTTDMKELTKYEFRVIAVNKIGKSKPSEPSNSVQLVPKPKEEPKPEPEEVKPVEEPVKPAEEEPVEEEVVPKEEEKPKAGKGCERAAWAWNLIEVFWLRF